MLTYQVLKPHARVAFPKPQRCSLWTFPSSLSPELREVSPTNCYWSRFETACFGRVFGSILMLEDQQMVRNEETNQQDSDPLLQKKAESFTVSSSDIKDEEIDTATAACCRICLEYDSEQGDKLISPCMCKGTQQFVHRSCLDHWRSVKEGFAFSHCTTCKAQFHLRVEFLEDYSWRKMKFRIFVARDVFLVFLAIQTAIAIIGGFVYFLDKNGSFRNSFTDGWDRILSKHPIPFYYCIGVLVFFVLLGFFGLMMHCSSFNNNDPCITGCRNCCYGWGILDCFPASMEACFVLVVIFVIVFAILGIAYGFLAATMAVQRIWQRHYHILTKRELTKEYVVEDLRGCYSPPKLDFEHEQRLKMLNLL